MSRFAFLDRHGHLVVWGMAAAYVAVYFSVCLTKLRYYLYNDFDLALFTQAAHQITQGSLWNSIRGMNWIGDHSSLVLFLVAPLQWVWPGPASLLFVQTAALALGAFAAWRLARHEGLAEPAPVLFAALYLLHPAIGYTNLFEFHPEVLSTSALLFAFLALRTGSRRALVLWSLLALLGKEDVALPVFMMGLYALTLRRPGSRGDAAWLIGLATLSLIISFAWLKTTFNQGDVDYGDMYRRLGDTTGQRVAYVFLHPAETLAALFTVPGDPTGSAIKADWYLHMLGPLLFLPLAAPLVLLLCGPTIAEHMLSNRAPQHSIVFQYTAYVTPLMVAAAVLGTKQVVSWLEQKRKRRPKSAARPGLAAVIAAAAVAAAITAQITMGPLSEANQRLLYHPIEAFKPDPVTRALKPIRDRLIAQVPPRGGVIASFVFMPRLSARAVVHSAHHLFRGTFTYSRRPFPIPTDVDAFIADMGGGTSLSYQRPVTAERIRELCEKNRLRPADAGGDHVLFLKDARDTVELVTAHAPAPTVPMDWSVDDELRGAGFDSVEVTVAPGGQIEFFTHWRRTGAAARLYLMDVMLVDRSGELRMSHPRVLGYGVLPVTAWPEGEVMREFGRYVLPLNTPPGDYVLAIAMRWRDARLREPPPPTSAADPRVLPIGFVTVTESSATSPPPARERGR